jgi:DNA-directed RNA polymerase specialized sigma24 family protein
VDLNDPTFVQGLASGNRQNLDEFQEEFYNRFREKSLRLIGNLGIQKNIKDEAHKLAIEVLFELDKYLDFAGKSGDHIELYCWRTFWRLYNQRKKDFYEERKEASKLSLIDDVRDQLVAPYRHLSIEQRLDIARALKELKEDELTVFKLRFMEGYSEADTANIARLSLKTVKAVVLRIRRKMMTILEGKPKPPEEGK